MGSNDESYACFIAEGSVGGRLNGEHNSGTASRLLGVGEGDEVKWILHFELGV